MVVHHSSLSIGRCQDSLGEGYKRQPDQSRG